MRNRITSPRWCATLFIVLFTILGCQKAPSNPKGTTTIPKKQTIIDSTTVRQLVDSLPTERSSSGSESERAGLLTAQEHLLAQLREMGYEPTLEPIEWTLTGRMAAKYITGRSDHETLATDQNGQPWNNIIVEIPGTTRSDEILLIGAHYDAVPGSPGADDNGSAVAGLLLLASTIQDELQADDKPDRTIRLVFFNLEEIGLIGSNHHADEAAKREETIIGMVSLEMIGFYSDQPDSQKSPIPPIENVYEPPTVADFIALVGPQFSAEFIKQFQQAMNESEPAAKTFAFDLAPGKGHLMPDIRRSDHASFLDHDIPAFMLTDTANFRNPNYHHDTDTSDTLDYELTALTIKAMVGAVHRLARPDEGSGTGL